jgi:hypothetical protein
MIAQERPEMALQNLHPGSNPPFDEAQGVLSNVEAPAATQPSLTLPPHA